MNIPQGYKQTELGIIPEDWTICKICDGLADVKSGKRLPLGYYVTEDRTSHPYIRVIDMYDGGVDVSNIMYVPEDAYPAIEKYRIYKNDIFISVAGSLGIVGKIPEKLDGANLTENANRLTNISCNRDYLLFFLRSPYIQQIISAEQTIGAQPKLALTRIRNFEIILPNTQQEQNAIAEALSDVDALIAALDKKIAKKRLVKQGAMQQLLTGKKRLSGFADKWITKKLGDFARLLNGYAFHSETYSDIISYKIITIANVQKGLLDMSTYNSIDSLPADIQSHQILKIGDILISMTGNVGRVCIVNSNNCLLNQRVGLIDILPKIAINREFLFNVLHSSKFEDAMIDSGQGAAQANISKSDIENYIFSLPINIQEQQAIATILSDMDKEIADLEARRDKYKLIKSGMMQKLLTGQIRLTKPQAKVIPLATQIPATREIPVAAHIIAGHIVYRSNQSRGWGRTKLQKSLHLIGYSLQLNLGNEYIRNTAGPDDQLFMNYIDQKFKQYRHVNIVKEKLPDGRTHYTYIPTAQIQEVEMAYEQYPQDVREQIDALLDKLNAMDLAGAEILSTLYAVWNNRIIKGEPITDNLLISDFYAWSAHKADFEEIRVRKALDYMRTQNIIPVGWGKYIDKK